MDTTSTAVAGAVRQHSSCRLNAGGAGQVDVHEHDVRRAVQEDRQRLLGGARGAGDLDVRKCREQPGEAVAEDGMIIDDQDPGHAGTAGTGDACAGAVTAVSRASTVTPGEASLTVTAPPSCPPAPA